MHKYELTLVLDGKTGMAKKKKVGETLASIIKLFKGQVKEEKEWGAREMAYKIGKSETGFYLYYELELDGKGVKALNDKLRINADLLRFLLIRKYK